MSIYTFSKEMSNRFAGISGDYNPVHLDDEVARRTYFGSTIVHGVHLLLQGCDQLCAEVGRLFVPKLLKASFNKPVASGDEVDYSWEIDTDNGIVRLKGICHKVQVFRAVLYIQDSNNIREEYFTDDYCSNGNYLNNTEIIIDNKPMELDESQLDGVSGKVFLKSPLKAEVEELFPNLCNAWPRNVLHGMLFATNIIGMHAPGLYSIFSNIDISWDYLPAEAGNSNIAGYKVVNIHPTIHRCEVAANGADWRANLQAFVRPKPCAQLPYADIRSRLSSDTFIGQRALVLGGSRGIGEVTSKLLAAGGAEVVLTYARSRNNAERIIDEISSGGGKSWALEFDAENLNESIECLLPSGWHPTHLYYFITPPIAGDKHDFSVRLFNRYILYYVTTFAKVISGLRKASSDLHSVLWPSSVAITHVPSGMVEYAMAKSSGEVLCKSIMHALPGLQIYLPRLPRIRTDLTANPLVADGLDAVETMLPILIEFAQNFNKR